MPNNLQEFLPSFCDKCGHKFEKTSMEIVSKDENKTVARISCNKCHNTFLMHFAMPAPGVATSLRLPFKSAITTNELRKFSESSKIETVEALDVYISLKEVKTIGDFNNLFRKRKD